MYIERKSRWNTIFCLGGDLAKKRGLAESDVVAEIAKHRKAKKASS